MAKLIGQEYNNCLDKVQNMWLSDDGSDITSNFDPDGAIGSTIIVISTQSVYMKNTVGKWQKCGSKEVL
jgi:hypothetical protein